jgi:hypothetical protein
MEEKSSSPGLDAERIAHHLQRPGFGISELQIGPAQQVPGIVTRASVTPSTCLPAGSGCLWAIPRSTSNWGRGSHGARFSRFGRTG